MDTNKKVLFLSTSFPQFIGDSNGNWVFNIAKELSKSQDVTVICPDGPETKNQEIMENILVERFQYFPKKKQKLAYGFGLADNLKKSWLAKLSIPFFLLSFIFKTRKHLKSSKIVHGHFALSGLIAHWARKTSRKKPPLIISFYGKDINHWKSNKFLYKGLIKSASFFIAISEDMKKILIKELEIPKEKILVNYLGIDLEKFKENPHEDHKKITILNVSRFVKKKGNEYTILAYKKVAEKFPNSELRFIGDGPLLKDLQELAQNEGITEQVKFINNYDFPNPRKKVLEEFQSADIFILTSVTDQEDYGGTPIVLSEAQALKLPCVVTDNSGNKEVVIDNKKKKLWT